MTDGQVQYHQAVAARRISQCEGRPVGAFGVGVAINPGEGLASDLFVESNGRTVDGQMERHHAVTSYRIGQRESRLVGAFGVGIAINPSECSACGLFVNASGGWQGGQNHSDNGVAAVDSLQRDRLRTRFGELNAIPSSGQFACTDSLSVGDSICRVNRQVQCHHAVVACRIGHRAGIITGLGVDSSVPGKAFTGDSRSVSVCGTVNRQVQCHHTVAAHRICHGMLIITRLRVCDVIPRETLAGHSGGVTGARLIECEA